MKKRLFTPGPTPVPEEVMLRMAEPIIHHRNPEFMDILSGVHNDLKYLFQTAQPVVVLSASGTGGMEAAVSSCFQRGDKLITVNGGKFGARWTSLARIFTGNCIEEMVPWGEAVTPERILELLKAHPDTKGVCLTHSETSTGTASDIQTLCSLIREHSDALILIDGITAIGAHEFHFDEWGADICITGSQKGLMMPPGLALVAVSERAQQIIDALDTTQFYLSLKKALASHAGDDTPFTPAVSLIIGLSQALKMIRREGIEQIWNRHERLSAACRKGCEALGMRLFSSSPSFAVTPAWLPEGIDWEEFNASLKVNNGITIAAGQDDYKGRIFRISHLGYYDELDMLTVIGGIERALAEVGHDFTIGAGVTAVQTALID
ncbi:alanine--glyoxylate aminotransferase family protein [Prosthecochloris sp. N3]|uniref:Alanine--glyoxylate aminotransferase family protein n=1 Tax=Prosthecochloris ethylica TaxID=2743976 RepID=A0ABR9XP57_9CHLB|nr:MULTISPECIES: alanine--glyoxylate aminotransferase family protein [Prosthecochloris]MBF0585896.1 alanine--glyoxylate aminotransferase family protein [Prosthecochloris ethylica]MBF0635806.1 alanine--glyoxylate aminotransferase family protein [Prosthecochloris ethylica]NUK47104.1 alanine--glyoxylate aminotransferase family protein [Prosthecochloris ethylica]RNA65582.1 alanine--glyoxylate aminotransferase family protein [Prosthecochloris sp. ZM_2]